LLTVLPWQAAFAQPAELIPVDHSELSERHPLILIHGISPSKDKQYDWELFLKRTKEVPAFDKRYKPYLFTYSPAELIHTNAQALRDRLAEYKKGHPQGKPFRFVAQSMGGIVLRDALNDPELWNQTDRVIALGTAFHGSPLTNAPWMRARLRESSLISQFRQLNRVSYWVFGRMFPNYKEDLCWDNFDGHMPEEFARNHTCQALTSIHPPEEEIQKYIVYAGFFGETQAEGELLGTFLGVPNERASRKIKNPFSMHLILRLIRPDLAYITLATDSNAPLQRSLMWFNDGVSPITSQLWLGRYLNAAQRPIPQETEWQTIKTLQAYDNSRLFEGLDHRDWLQGSTRYRNPDGKLLDWLHPNEPPRDVFDWILSDLMR
jgi:hypothetical protein